MRTHLLSTVVGIVSAIAVVDARADASATISFGGTPTTLSQTGFLFSGGSRPISLAPGASQDFTVQYTITVHDDGLPAPFDPKFIGCLPLHTVACNPPYTGFEVARATFDLGNRDGRVANPFITLTSDTGTLVSLETHGDSFAETLTRSGTIHYRLSNDTPFFQTDNVSFFPYLAEWVLAVPEPATYAQLALGLGLLGLLKARASPSRAARTPA